MKIFRLLLFLSLFDVFLILIRNQQWGDGMQAALVGAHQLNLGFSFLFLVWNLILAWIPYGLSRLLKHTRSKLLLVLVLVLWLLFLPNAPYIITDFIHLKSRSPIPVWFDLFTFFAFAWTGILLGILSLLQVEVWWEEREFRIPSNYLPILIWPLCGIGVYLGRFLRWNSWEVFTQPLALLKEAIQLVQNPVFISDCLSIILPFTGLLFIIYYPIRLLYKQAAKRQLS